MTFRITRPKILASLAILGLAGGAVQWACHRSTARATAKTTPVDPASSIAKSGEPSDYDKRVVAYIYDKIPITRRELGEYLIARHGAENIDKMVGQYVIELEAAQNGMSVSAAEVDADVQEMISETKPKMNQKQFAELVVNRYGKTFPEWKLDVVKHRLLLTKLCRDRVSVSDEELERGFESTCGDKIRARVIIWPKEEHNEAVKQYSRIRNNADEFDKCARQQKDESLAAKGGEMELFHNFTSSPETEKAAFALHPDQVSQLIEAPDGWLVIKCIEHIPGTPGVKLEDVREDLRREALSRKLHKVEIPRFLAELKEKSHPKILLEKVSNGAAVSASSGDPSNRVVAIIYDKMPITREQLGEWLISRFGVDEVENLVNRRILDCVAREKGIDLPAAEVEANLKKILKGLNVNADQFEKTVLKPRGRNLVGWREDEAVCLMLTRLCRDRLQVKEEDVKNAYTAFYGEKIQARIIMWPMKEQHVAMALYPKIRASEAEFDRVARTQADADLSARGGEVEPFGRHTTGNEEMEKAAFNLEPGEISHLIGTPQGFVVVKCVKRIPPQTEVKLEDVRAQLTEDYINRRIRQVEIPKLCRELHAQAQPKIFIKKETMDDVKYEARRQVSEN